MIDILWLDDGFEIVLQDFCEIVLSTVDMVFLVRDKIFLLLLFAYY